MAIQELTKVELEEVSGGIVGDIIQSSANLFALTVNYFVGPNFGPVTAIAKQANDSWYALGQQLGGNTQKIAVKYNPIPSLFDSILKK